MKVAGMIMALIGGLFALVTGILMINIGTLSAPGMISVWGGVIGLLGCVIALKSKIVAGAFMAVGALVCFIADFNVISAILLGLGAAFLQSDGRVRNDRRKELPPWISLKDEAAEDGGKETKETETGEELPR